MQSTIVAGRHGGKRGTEKMRVEYEEMRSRSGASFGLHYTSAESAIILEFETVALRRGIFIRQEEADRVRALAEFIVERICGGGGAGREEPSGRRYAARERDDNLKNAVRVARRLAIRTTERARDGLAEAVEDEFWIGDQRIRFRTTPGLVPEFSSPSELFASLCPPPLPPFC